VEEESKRSRLRLHSRVFDPSKSIYDWLKTLMSEDLTFGQLVVTNHNLDVGVVISWSKTIKKDVIDHVFQQVTDLQVPLTEGLTFNLLEPPVQPPSTSLINRRLRLMRWRLKVWFEEPVLGSSTN